MGNGNTKSAGQPGDALLKDPSAFAEMTARYYGRVYFIALSITRDVDTAQDVAQETFLRAWLKRDSVTQPALQLQPWLGRIAGNLAIQWQRKGQRRSRLLPLLSMEELTVEPADPSQPNPRQSASREEHNGQLTDAVMRLPEELRQVILLHYGEGLAPADIARLNGEARSTVTRRLEKAHLQLRQYLESGLAAGMAALKPGNLQLDKTLGLLVAAAALPAATRAELLQLAADTPPPPLIDPVTLAAKGAASIEEPGLMKSIIATTGATKLVIAVTAAIIIGGGAFAVSSLSNQNAINRASAEFGDVATSSVGRLDSGAAKLVALKGRKSNDPAVKLTGEHGNSASDATSESRRKLRPEERIALLENDLVSTSPELVTLDGETTSRIYFNVEVVDESGLPVEGAEVTVFGFRALIKMDMGSRGFRGGPVAFKTNKQGIARPYVPQYYEENLETGGAIFVVSHPEYAPSNYEIDFRDAKKVVLKRGGNLVIFAYDELSSAPVKSGIRPKSGNDEMAADNPLATGIDWYLRGDGAIVIRRIKDGPVGFYVEAKGEEGKISLSDYQNLRFPREPNEPLHLALKKTYRVAGSLSSNVPRPVKNAKALAGHASGADNCGKYGYQEVHIRQDGTFELTGLPAGEIMIWALADGWSSVSGTPGKTHGAPQTFDLKSDEQPYVLPMQATATAIFKFVDSDNKPVEGVEVHSTPNMCREGCCGGWIRNQFKGISDKSGIVVIPDLPPLPGSRFYTHGDWELPPVQPHSDDIVRTVVFDLNPGETLERTVTVYLKGATVITQDGDKITTVPGTSGG